MSLTKTKKLVLGATVGAVAMLGALAPAMAHGKHRHFRHFHFHSAPVVTYSYYRTSCDYYYWKWQHTGSRYWKHKYFHCVY